MNFGLVAKSVQENFNTNTHYLHCSWTYVLLVPIKKELWIASLETNAYWELYEKIVK